MSFHSLMTAAAAWPADLVSAGIVATAGQAYTGRRPRDKVNRNGEVWIERLPEPQPEGNGFQHIRRYPYLLHYRYPSNAGTDQAGGTQITHVEAKLAAIRERYHATFSTWLESFLVPTPTAGTKFLAGEAVEESIDVDPEDADVLEGIVRVTFSVRE
ncbi:MAG TPA: hypothetical protein VEA38_16845 [Terriglobales bacterium]|nr:hypothetical protein [Terriglobales bacterium]